MRRIHEKPDFTPVAAGATAIAQLPLGLPLHAAFLYYTPSGSAANDGTIAADIDRIRVKVNGQTKWEATGAQALDLSDFYGLSREAGIIPIYFSKPTMRTAIGEDALAWGTLGIQQLTVEVDIDGAATAPQLDWYVWEGAPADNRVFGAHYELRQFTFNVGATGEIRLQDLPPRGERRILALHLGTASCTEAQLNVNDRVVFNATAAIAKQMGHAAGRAWQTGYFHIDMIPTDRIVDSLFWNAEATELILQMGGTGNVTMLAEVFEGKIPV